jgi:hypothetical protein
MNNPNGDPTPRTLDQLRQSMSGLRELFETKFDGYDKAIRLLQDRADSQPTPGVLEVTLIALKENMEIRFHELDVRTNAVATSNKNSIDLALQAAKEAASKSENAFNKQIDSLAAQFNASVSSLETRINDTKEQVITIVAGGQGSKQSYGAIATTVGLIIGAASIVVAIILSQGAS